MEKRKKVRTAPFQTPQMIGVMGVGAGVGCTHFAVMLINYLTGYRRKRSVLLEWNRSGDLERLEKVCTGTVEEKKPYRVLDAVYYKNAGTRELAEALKAGYEAVVLDFGAIDDKKFAEFLRCGDQFLVVSFSEWQESCFREFILGRGRADKKSWRYVASFGSEETRKEYRRRFGVLTERIPFSADAFSVTKECGEFFGKLLPEQ